MRQASMRIAIYDEAGDTAGIVKELVSFLRIIIFFDNVYAVNSAAAKLKQDDDDN